MSRLRMRRTLCVLCGILALLAAGSAWTGILTAAPDTREQATVPLLIVPPASRPGIYAVADTYGLDPSTYHLAGGYTTFRWSDFEEGTQGVYDWSDLDSWLDAQTALGRAAGFGLSIYNGRAHSYGDGLSAIPAWLRTEPQAYVTASGGWKIPKYWYSVLLDAYADFVEALAARYGDDPRVEFIAIGTGMYGETKACDSWDLPSLETAGLTSAKWMETLKAITDFYVAAFTESGQLQKVLVQQYAPFTFDNTERRDIANYSTDHGVGLSYNALYPDDEYAVVGDSTSKPWVGKYDQMIDPVTLLPSLQLPLAFETYEYMLCNPTHLYWGIINGLNKHVDYFRLNRDLFKDESTGADVTENLGIFGWAKDYVGVTLQDAPSVWVALREHRLPWKTCWQATADPGPWYPQWGNYSFWLYQDDGINGGRTLLETNDSTITGFGNCGGSFVGAPPCQPDPYRSYLPAGREAWVTRRTDQATANPYMWFKVDDGYISGGSNAVRVTITYLDRGSDTWSLRYDAADGSEKSAMPVGAPDPWVQKASASVWRQAVFEISDARFANGLEGGSDFRLDCRNDGDEWVHFVDVAKTAPGGPTATSTPTPTPSPTPTPTATPTPTPLEGCYRGDFNVDCQIDILDVMDVANRWGCGEGQDPCYDERHDLNGNEGIDTEDIMIVVGCWGCRCDDACWD